MFNRLAILLLLGVSLVCAKTYTFTVFEPSQAGKAQLAPGVYKVKVEGSQVVLTDNKGKALDATAKVETAERKFVQTGFAVSKGNGPDKINWIGLGGTTTKVVFQ